MAMRVTDVEVLKKQARKLAAGKVLAGGSADVRLELGRAGGSLTRICTGYGYLGDRPEPLAHDRVLWVLDGHAEVHSQDGAVTVVSSGESVVLYAGTICRLFFPQLTLYLAVEAGAV